MEDHEVDNQQDAGSEKHRVGGDAAGLQITENPAGSGCQACAAAYDDAEDELVKEVNECRAKALNSLDEDFVVESVDVETVGEKPGNRVGGEPVLGRCSDVADDTEDAADDESPEGNVEGNKFVNGILICR